ncbi:carbohydrate kinase family protein [Crateriforma conspicua]|uniref:carbohydrate kinase family protein n=1 Tax=Crateriforma conspicua TaxID=2527996 RepID=UPI0011899B26|nr:carbohydrate kinase [Crateriforma conspicua]QDV64747.1 5-dehydro-2-deoxygluconokinase [Crateriforma conspicua]
MSEPSDSTDAAHASHQDHLGIPTGLRPVIVGEALIDSFPDGRDIVGGAPLNVAWNLRGFGRDPVFVSKIGNDNRGRLIFDKLKQWGMNTDGVVRGDDRETGIVKVTLTNGTPDYDLVYPVAYDFIDAPGDLTVQPPDACLLYLGTLAWRRPESMDILRSWVQSNGTYRFIDINMRPPWVRDDVVDCIARDATFFKLNDEELSSMTGQAIAPESPEFHQQVSDAVARLRDRWNCRTFFVTCGPHGAFAVTPDASVFVPAPKLAKMVDTVGAGDAFAAATIDGLLSGQSMEACLNQAIQFAARICQNAGATSTDGNLYQLEQYRS